MFRNGKGFRHGGIIFFVRSGADSFAEFFVVKAGYVFRIGEKGENCVWVVILRGKRNNREVKISGSNGGVKFFFRYRNKVYENRQVILNAFLNKAHCGNEFFGTYYRKGGEFCKPKFLKAFLEKIGSDFWVKFKSGKFFADCFAINFAVKGYAGRNKSFCDSEVFFNFRRKKGFVYCISDCAADFVVFKRLIFGVKSHCPGCVFAFENIKTLLHKKILIGRVDYGTVNGFFKKAVNGICLGVVLNEKIDVFITFVGNWAVFIGRKNVAVVVDSADIICAVENCIGKPEPIAAFCVFKKSTVTGHCCRIGEKIRKKRIRAFESYC